MLEEAKIAYPASLSTQSWYLVVVSEMMDGSH